MTEKEYITVTCLRSVVSAIVILRQAAAFEDIAGKEVQEALRLLCKSEEKLFKKVGTFPDIVAK